MHVLLGCVLALFVAPARAHFSTLQLVAAIVDAVAAVCSYVLLCLLLFFVAAAANAENLGASICCWYCGTITRRAGACLQQYCFGCTFVWASFWCSSSRRRVRTFQRCDWLLPFVLLLLLLPLLLWLVVCCRCCGYCCLLH